MQLTLKKCKLLTVQKPKSAIFLSLIWGQGGSKFSIYFVQDCGPFLCCPWPKKDVIGTHS